MRLVKDLIAMAQKFAMNEGRKKRVLSASSKPKPAPFVLDYTPSYSGFTRWRSNPNWPGRRAAAALRTAGKTRRMR